MVFESPGTSQPLRLSTSFTRHCESPCPAHSFEPVGTQQNNRRKTTVRILKFLYENAPFTWLLVVRGCGLLNRITIFVIDVWCNSCVLLKRRVSALHWILCRTLGAKKCCAGLVGSLDA